jgi:hypothetical protein
VPTIEQPVIDRKDWAAVQELIAEIQQTQRYAAGILLLDATVRIFRNLELQLIAKAPTAHDLEVHEALLHSLIGLGQLLELRIQNISDDDLAVFDIQRENLSAYVRELQESFAMWHGPDLPADRVTELEKRIFGAVTS